MLHRFQADAVRTLICTVLAANYVMPVQAADQCSDVLQQGIFNTTTVNQSVGIKNDYNAWLCTTEFRTHQEAHDAGVQIGFPVYDVPIQIGGTFDQSARDTWKKNHCSSTVDKSQYSALYQKVVTEISDNTVNAWRDCMISLYQVKLGLNGVALSHGPTAVSMKIRWTPLDGFDTRLPKVTGYTLVGAKIQTVGNTLFSVGTNVPATETIVDFTRDSARSPVVITLNTDRGSVTAYVPAQSMSIKLHGQLSPTIEQHQVATKDYSWYQADPDDDCVKDLNFDQTFYPPDGYTFTSYTFEETTKNGDRTGYSSKRDGNGVAFHMHVQGDDGFGGFCKRHGWLGLNIHVTGERWVRNPMTVWESDATGAPLQETLLLHYPYLQPSADVRNFQLAYVATVDKVIGDDVSRVQLTDGAPSASGITSKGDASGNLVLDASQAFTTWRQSLGGGEHNLLLTETKSTTSKTKRPGTSLIDEKAKTACSTGPNKQVYEIEYSGQPNVFTVTCGPLAQPAAGAANRKLSVTSVDVSK